MHLAIQNQINIAEDNPSPAPLHHYFLNAATTTIKYVNAHASKVHAEIYYYRARRDTAFSAEDSYDTGFSEHSAYGSTGTRATPYMSPDFVSKFQILRVQRKHLEQGEHFTVHIRQGPMKINSDIFNSVIHIRGSYGVAVKFVGDLGYNTVNGNVSTTAVKVLYERVSKVSYRRMTDSIPTRVRIGDELPAGQDDEMKFANSDTGTAVQGAQGMHIF